MNSLIPFFIIIGFAVLVSTLWYIQTYNRFIKVRNRIEESWSGIDVALKRRFNLIPNLVRAVEGYAAHEEEALAVRSYPDAESAAADAASISEMGHRMADESRISKSLNGLLALGEAYPDLKASGNFLALQDSLDEIEQDIQQARNRFNQAVRRNNTLVESFPSNWIARKYGFGKMSYFTLELATQRELPEVDFASQSKGRP